MPSESLIRPDLVPVVNDQLKSLIEQDLIFPQIAIETPRPEKKGQYSYLNKGALLPLEQTKRAPRTSYGRSNYEVEDKNYNTEGHGWEEAMDDDEANGYSSTFNAQLVAGVRATRILFTNYEWQVAQKTQDINNAGTNITAGTSWLDLGNADIKKDIDNLRDQMEDKHNIEGSVLVVSAKMLRAILNNGTLKDTLKFTQPIEITPQQQQLQTLAAYLGISKVLIGKSKVKTESSNIDKRNYTQLWRNDTASLFQPIEKGSIDLLEDGFMRMFTWEKGSGLYELEEYREEKISSDIIRAKGHIDPNVINYKALGVITGINANVTTP